MPLFTSKRERRLWILALAVIVAIYSTLGLAARLEGLLDPELISTGFWIGLALCGVAVLVLGLKTRPGWAVIGVLVGILGAYLIVFLRMTIPGERSHIIEYTIVALLVYEALKERAQNDRRVPRPDLLAILLTVLVGVLDELIQAFLPIRIFDLRDILFNVLAAVMAVTAAVVLAWARNGFGLAKAAIKK